jgi:putative endonuclease
MIHRRAVGQAWERVAERHLRGNGLKTLTRNYLCRGGEIDLVMMDGDTLVFVEVRYRRTSTHGSGAESVTHAKQRRIALAANHYLAARNVPPSLRCRFDIVSISGNPGAQEVDWIRSAFDAA